MDNPDHLLPASAATEVLDGKQSPAMTGPASAALGALFQQALEQSFNSVLLTDAEPSPNGPRILYANPAFCRMTGYQAEELIGRTPRLLQGPQTNPEVLRELSACLREGRYFQGSTINYRKDGSPYTVEWNISPVRNKAGVITHFVSAQQDISGLVAARRSAQLLTKALNVSQDAIFITSANGVIEFVNQGFELVTGYSSAEALGRTPAILKSDEHGQDFYQRLWHSLLSGQNFRATLTNRHKKGHLIYCEETITPVHDSHGVVTHFVCIAKDLSTRIQAERELRKQAMFDGLTGLLNRRSGELELEKAYLASHDGKTPLCVLMADIDHFKAVNDTWGHPAGDAVLKSVSSLLRANVRATDKVARWGGEEFLIVLPYCELSAAQKLAERIRSSVESAPQPDAGRITLSIGVAQAQDDETLFGLFNRVDKALYRAKKAGRNQVSCA